MSLETWYQEDLGPNDLVVELDPKLLGQLLMSIDVTRACLGHTTIRSSLRYIHSLEGLPEFEYIKEIIMRESTRGK